MSNMKPVLGTQLRAGHPLARGLVACWLMNEGSGGYIYDLSGNRHTGTLGTGATSPTWSSGGISFGPSESRIVSPAAAGFNPAAGSIEMLVRPTWDNTDGLNHFFWDTYGGANRIFRLYKHANNNIYLYTDYTYRGNFPYPWAAGTLYHIVLNWGTNQLYINGILEQTFDPGGLGAGASTLYIGDHVFQSDNSFSGAIYYFIARDVPLTAPEVARLYQEPFAMFDRDRRQIWPF